MGIAPFNNYVLLVGSECRREVGGHRAASDSCAEVHGNGVVVGHFVVGVYGKPERQVFAFHIGVAEHDFTGVFGILVFGKGGRSEAYVNVTHQFA